MTPWCRRCRTGVAWARVVPPPGYSCLYTTPGTHHLLLHVTTPSPYVTTCSRTAGAGVTPLGRVTRSSPKEQESPRAELPALLLGNQTSQGRSNQESRLPRAGITRIPEVLLVVTGPALCHILLKDLVRFRHFLDSYSSIPSDSVTFCTSDAVLGPGLGVSSQRV